MNIERFNLRCFTNLNESLENLEMALREATKHYCQPFAVQKSNSLRLTLKFSFKKFSEKVGSDIQTSSIKNLDSRQKLKTKIIN